MRYLMLSAVLLFAGLMIYLASACAPEHPPHRLPPGERLAGLWAEFSDEAAQLSGGSCWLVTGGDGALWSGKYAAVSSCSDYGAAEVEPGRWLRSPGYVPESPSQGWSSWSRDMGEGFLTYALQRGDLGALERHERYGRGHAWKMGIPLGDGRAVYSGNMLAYLYSGIKFLGGADTVAAEIPTAYDSGLVDYESHLAVQGIWLHGKARGGVTAHELNILREQAERDRADPLFAGVLAQYSGEHEAAVEVCLGGAESGYAGEYVRCGDAAGENVPRRCFLAAWLFACSLVR